MPAVSQIIKFRQTRHSKDCRSPWGRIGILCALLVSLLMVAISGVGIKYYFDLIQGLPSINTLPGLLEPPDGILLQPSKMYDRTHLHVILSLENPAAAGRQYLVVAGGGQGTTNSASKYLMDATVAAFDPGFWEEAGYSLSGIPEGTHPTLAQQLASDLLLSDEPASIKRNLQERLLAMQVTAQFGREKVLEWYLNTARYGEFVYGADAAARVYLGKPATQLTIAEAAMLTAMAESHDLNPWPGRQLLRDRQVQIIQAMLQHGLIGVGDANKAIRENVIFQPPPVIHSLAPDFTNYILLQIASVMPLEQIYRGGYEIDTTLDFDLQLQAQCATQAQLDRLEYIGEQAAVENGNQCEAASLLPSFRVEGQKSLDLVKADVLVLDSSHSEILAWVGGEDSDPAPSKPAIHPAGNILSPFLYLTAFTRGLSPASLLWDLPSADEHDLSTQALATYHGPVRLRMAMVNDYAGAEAEVLGMVGAENVWQTQQKFGIIAQPALKSTGLMLTDLSSQEVSLVDVLRAYSVFGNQGVMTGREINQSHDTGAESELSVSTILRIKTINGQAWLDWSTEHVRPIVSAQLAYLITDVLSDKEARSQSLQDANPSDIGRPVGVKASLSADGQEVWIIGYTPQLAVGVWMEASAELNEELASGIWHAIMEYSTRQLPVMDFVIPPGISRAYVCDPSGRLVSPWCASKVEEVFLEGNEPTQTDDLYQEFLIDRQTGRLATIFTPSELVERKIFLVVPDKARQWAQAVGLATPPDVYDEINPPVSTSDEVKFKKPRMFEHVGGKVDIFGNAMGEGFSYYRLQVGQGLNPQQWIQIGQDIQQPAQEGLLGTWDTNGLDGNYILELLVVKQDLRVERDLLQVSIDNHPPEVRIRAPLEKNQFTLSVDGTIILQADTRDDHGVDRVEFYVDGKLVSTLYEPPFIALWPAQAGLHSLRMRAYDQAGNWSDAETSFSVTG
jgi:membrane carboxypeptidase/penicillin-binding protein